MDKKLILRIILSNPTVGVVFGLQQGSGSQYETIQKQKCTSQELIFSCPVIFIGDENKDPQPKPSGPFVQGSAPNKFIYIDIGTCAGQTDTPWSRRLKIPLSGITWYLLHQLAANPTLVLGTQVEGTGRDGGPNCATVKPFPGWQLMGE